MKFLLTTLLRIWNLVGNIGFCIGLIVFNPVHSFSFQVPILGTFSIVNASIMGWWYVHGFISRKILHLTRQSFISTWTIREKSQSWNAKEEVSKWMDKS